MQFDWGGLRPWEVELYRADEWSDLVTEHNRRAQEARDATTQ